MNYFNVINDIIDDLPEWIFAVILFIVVISVVFVVMNILTT